MNFEETQFSLYYYLTQTFLKYRKKEELPASFSKYGISMITKLEKMTRSIYVAFKKKKLGDPWVAQWFSAYLPPRP